MSTKLRYSPTLALPVNAVTQRFGFLGRIGTGKSYAAMKLAELMLDVGAQVVALDPVGVWYGLRVDGKGKGYPIPVFGGLHGDVPLEPGAGAMIADLIVDRRLSCVIDVSQFEHNTDKARFMTAFLSRFFFRKKAAPSAVHLFFEECQEFFPQQPAKGEELMLSAGNRMAKLGRNFGIGMSLITQRPQEVSKKSLNLTECLLAFQMTGSHERKAIKEWIATVGADENMLEVLPTLPVGVAHVYSPQWLRISEQVKCFEKRSADVSSTPQVDDAPVETKPLTPVDLGKIRDAMVATIEKAKADDPKALRAEIARLTKQVASAPSRTVEKPVVDERAIARAVAAAIRGKDADIASIQKRLHSVHREATTAAAAATAAVRLVGEIQMGIANMNTEGARAAAPPVYHEKITTGVPAKPRQPARETISHEGVTGVEQRILNTLRGLEDLGITQPDKATAAALVGYHPNAKSYANALGSLRSAGRIEYPTGGVVCLTDEGRALSESQLAISSVAELHEVWFDKLGNVAKKILAPLIETYPGQMDRSSLAEAAEYHPNAKSFANMIGRLRSLGLIDYPSQGKVVATNVLFPEGLV